ncbi:TetR/AcrR family transcriptional regulator [uncultured Ferrimonas sp.]|uniref:TetR/AcrR family transcriptional regulator n=1 Tax=uncultured Ferrimonas sp. TaxID=432640 RepID=UPI0026035B46|nr:TetR/AcrR family transcriptional regulator [uncultured Ferrimonas sp.]
MAAKKSGRQSAESAQQTRDSIVCAAVELFADKGFEAVSVREIAEAAQVSHGLIRHHFGNKLQIWHRICELIVDDVNLELEYLLRHLDESLQPNERFFQLLSTLLASHLNDPRLMKLMSDAFRGDPEKFVIFNSMPDCIEQLMQRELTKVQQQGYLSGLVVDEVKWMLCMFADAPAMMEPMMLDIYGAQLQQAQLRHWQFSCRMIAAMLGVDIATLPQVSSLAEVATPREQYNPSCLA